MWRFTKFAETRPGWLIGAVIVLGMAAFLLILGPGLPYPTNSSYSDAVVSHWPNALFMKRQPFSLWNPHILSGLPFAANPLSKVWYPPQWLVLLLPPTLHLNVMIWLHLTLAGLGMWTFGRTTGLSSGPALLAVVAYAFAPKILAHLGAGHLDLVYAAAWLPWVLLAVHKLMVGDSTGRAVLRLGALSTLMLLADIRLSLFGLALAGAYGVWRWRPSENRRLLHLAVTASLIALALTAVQWIPLVALAPRLSRGGMTIEDAGQFALEPAGLIGLVLGNRAGHHETMVYTGLAVLVLAIIALLAKPRALGLWGAATIAAALYAMGPNTPLWPLLVRIFPPLLWFRIPSRAWFVAALTMPYLAGWGTQILARPDQSSRLRLAVAALLAGIVVCGGVGALLLTKPVGGPLDPTVPLSTLVIAILTTALTFMNRPPGKAKLITGALIGLVVVDLLWFGISLVEKRGPAYWLDPYRELAEYLRESGADRVYTPSNSLPQQAAVYWEIDLFGGVDPFQLQSYVEMAERATGIKAEGYAPSIPPYTGEGDVSEMWAGITPDAELMARWNVSHTVSAFPIEENGWQLDTVIGNVYVYENTFTAKATAHGDALTQSTYDTTPTWIGLTISVAALAVWAILFWHTRRKA